jgi:putative ABC transport system permease protein
MGAKINAPRPTPRIPKIPRAFFKWYCRADRYEELHGDLEELFQERALKSVVWAKIRYTWDVLKCFQPYAWDRSKNSSLLPVVMFRNYFKTSSRNLMKNPLGSFINVFGLSMAIGICIMLYGFADYVDRTDQFHEHKNEVYLITSFSELEGRQQQHGTTPAPLGEMLREDFSQIDQICRIKDAAVVVKQQDQVFHEIVRYADPSFLEFFTFPLKWGSITSLQDVNSIILSEEMALKYFGEENPLGRSVQLIFGDDRSKLFEVQGVAQKFPEARSVDFNFLINFENLKTSAPEFDERSWAHPIEATLIKIHQPGELKNIQRGMDKYQMLQNQKLPERPITSFGFLSIGEVYKKATDIRGGITVPYYKSNLTAVVILSIITLFLLALACFNYINIAIVSASKRLKEIGVRKVIGANRQKVIIQFLSENVLITSFALLFGLILGVFIFIPGFEAINDFSMDFTLAHPRLWLFLIFVLLMTGIISGLYPALYISRFEAVTIFRGSTKFGRQNPLSRILLGFQLILACVIITCAVMFTLNSSYVANRGWGYNPQAIIYAEVPHALTFEQLEASMIRNPQTLAISGSVHHLGKSYSEAIVYLPPNQQLEVQQLTVDPSYFATLEIPLLHGRLFHESSEADQQAVIVNETLVSSLQWKEAIGQYIEMDSQRLEVVGVVKDFHSYHFDSKIQPTVFKVSDRSDYRFITLRVRDGSEQESLASLQEQWGKLFPEIPFQGGYQEDVWGSFFNRIRNHGRFWQVIAMIATLLVGLGLYGLVTLNVTGRTKEFSIRKVLGAPTRTIATGILRQYTLLFVISLFLGAPISFLLVKALFDVAYDYHVPMNFGSVLLAIGLLVFVLLMVVLTQVTKVAKDSPVSGLKTE